MLHFLIIFTAHYAISFATETIEQKLETIKANLHNEENVFLGELPKAEAASNQKYAELAEKFKQFGEQCKTLDTLLREQFDMPKLLIRLNPAKRFHMETLYKEKTVCDDFLKLDAQQRFEQASRQHQLDNLELKLDSVEKTTNVNSREMQMLSGLIKNSIPQLIEHYDKIGKAVEEMGKTLEKLQNYRQEQTRVKDSLKTECEALDELISRGFNLPDEVVPQKYVVPGAVFRQCNDVLRAIGNAEEQTEKIENLNELLQSIKKMVGSKNHLTEARKLLEDAKKNLDKKIVKNLIQTYQSIGKANAELKNTLKECKQLYYDEDNKAPIQIKYFMELAKIGQEFSQNLRKCLHNGKAEDQKSELKKEKDEFVTKITSEIRYNGGKQGGPDFIRYAYDFQLEQPNVEENRKEIFELVERYSIVPGILNAEKETMENALQLLEVYKEKIVPIEEKSPTSSN